MSDPAIECHDLGRRYGRRWALAEISFKVAAGSVLMITGANGAGKSTLLRVLATAIRPDRGSASVGGFDVITHKADVRRRVALLSHHNYLYESLTARENLEVAASHLGGARNVDSLLEQVALRTRANDAVSTFSAGMRKRLSFARVLLQEPGIVLLDEPYGALDPEGFALIDNVIDTLRKNGATIAMATHQLERASRFADAALHLEGGRIAA